MPLSRYAPGFRRHLLTGWLVVFTALTFWALWLGTQSRHDLCLSVERDNREDRQEAWRSFNGLRRALDALEITYKTRPNGKLDLSHPKTKRLHDLARTSRDRKLALNKRKDC